MELLAIFLMLLIPLAQCVDRGNFKTCEQSGFCRRNRNLTPGQSQYYVKMSSLKTPTPGSLSATMVNARAGAQFELHIQALEDNRLRLRILEQNPPRPRYSPTEALAGEPKEASLAISEKEAESLTFHAGQNKGVLSANPFRLDIYSNDQLVLSANSRGLLNYEHHRSKYKSSGNPRQSIVNISSVSPPTLYLSAQVPQEGQEVEEKEKKPEENQDGWWEETFKGKTDSKPYGPMSVGMDFSFIGFEHLYGLPEHADQFVLKQTKGVSDPYRLYNLDVGEYELNNPMALYGSVPYVMAQSESRTLGLLWLNAAETWVDLEAPVKQVSELSANGRAAAPGSVGQGVVSSIVDFVKGGTPPQPQQDTHWFSESGLIDIFLFMGPGPKDVLRQFGLTLGNTALPPLFSVGYHQCRWNYKDQEDVRNVDSGFDEHDIPYDVIWLDVDHLDNRKYFTWDPYLFPNPTEMIHNLTAKGRKMVTLVDPHIKRDSSYFIHQEASSKGYYVKQKNQEDYEGWCWPGSSGYLDFLNPEVREWWAGCYALDKYQGSTLSLYTWNDMNEPSVFSDPEITMLKDNLHHGGWEHRDVHNMYGMYMVMGTHKGHLQRSDYKQRPFILSRAFFAGTQRYAAVWTGDNTADWGHLRISLPMMLTLSVSGMTFSGADVGGFFNNPTPEMTVRWYQAGAYQPFYRGHSHHDTKRREPWLFEEKERGLIRAAIRTRYSMLPLWYTLFHENERTGLPPMRPIWVEYPQDTKTYDMDDQYLVGNVLLVHPVTDIGVSSVSVYFPGGQSQVWYDIDTHQSHEGGHTETIPVDLSKTPVYQRGGSIMPRKERIRRSSSLTHHDPFTLYIALDKAGSSASGQLYIDSYDGYGYRNGDYLLINYTYTHPTLQARIVEGPGNYKTQEWLERVVIVGLREEPKTVQLRVDGEPEPQILQAAFVPPALVIRKPGVNMGRGWDITLTF
ncbi:GANC [Cordylochernes scorpioides]|uniref:Glucosidase II subunit alpha n=1 Tax=Cordylochernes scorpioides TaxID=51811 RepID=A0ABY6LPF0_9ARAC|nr:GANC [Cordylochernes scorpioides]